MTREEAIRYGKEWLKDEYLDAKDAAFIKMAIKAFEQEPCEDAISRQAMREKIDAAIKEMTKEECNTGDPSVAYGFGRAISILKKHIEG